jgi:hypothetical protein
MLAWDVGESLDNGRRSHACDMPQLFGEPAARCADIALGHRAQFLAVSCIVVAATI